MITLIGLSTLVDDVPQNCKHFDYSYAHYKLFQPGRRPWIFRPSKFDFLAAVPGTCFIRSLPLDIVASEQTKPLLQPSREAAPSAAA